jgi:hypothetical protein
MVKYHITLPVEVCPVQIFENRISRIENLSPQRTRRKTEEGLDSTPIGFLLLKSTPIWDALG